MVLKGECKMKNLCYATTEFDDWVHDEDGIWSMICEDCLQKSDFSVQYGIKWNEGNGLCGVSGCEEKDADHYIDFVVFK